MARRTSTTPIKNYVYGAMAPRTVEQCQVVADQVFKSHRYQNKLVEIERQRRTEYRDLRRSLSTTLDALEVQSDRLKVAVEAQYKALTSLKDPKNPKHGLPKADRAESPEAQAIIAELKRLKAERAVLFKQISQETKRVEAECFKAGDSGLKVDKEGIYLQYIVDFVPKKEEAKKAARRPAAREQARVFLAKGTATLDADERKAMTALIGKWCGPHIKKRLNAEILPVNAGAGSPWGKKSALDTKVHAANENARHESGCFPGSYLSVIKASAQSFSKSKGDPRFMPFDQTGAVGIEITVGGPISVRDALAGKNSKGKTPRVCIKMLDDTPIRGTRGAADFVRTMPEASPEQVVAAAHKQGFGPSFSVKSVLEIRASRRNRDARPEPRAAIVTLMLAEKDEDGNKVVIEVPIVMHRPLPEDGWLKGVYLHTKKIGLRKVYEMRFNVEAESFAKKDEDAKGTIAVNLGWRVLSNGDTLVATTWDGTAHEEIVLPAERREDEAFARRVLSACDQHFDDARGVFTKWYAQGPQLDPAIVGMAPEFWKNAHAWRAHGKLARATFMLRQLYISDDLVKTLWGKWKEERLRPRLPGQSVRDYYRTDRSQRIRGSDVNDLFGDFEPLSVWFEAQGVSDPNQRVALYLEWWRIKDAHLQNMARAIQNRIRLWRREEYRKAAARWGKTYEKVVVEDWNKSKTARTPTPDKNLRTPQEEMASTLRQFCGVSVLTMALEERFGKKRYHKEDAKQISISHFGCGGHASDTVPHAMVVCDTCERMFDQDKNAARHLWERSERSGGAPKGGVSRISKKASDQDEFEAAE